MEQVMIVGCPGAGKSTAARMLAARTGLPIVHLDYHYWQPGWIAPDKAAWREQVTALAARPRWIIDGNYGKTLDVRAARADTLIHLDFPTWLCLWRVIRRTIAISAGSARANSSPDARNGSIANSCASCSATAGTIAHATWRRWPPSADAA